MAKKKNLTDRQKRVRRRRRRNTLSRVMFALEIIVLVVLMGGLFVYAKLGKLNHETINEEELDVNVARVRSWNQLKIYPTRFNRRNPFRRQFSPQIWGLQLPKECCEGVHLIAVEASDQWGFKASGERCFYYQR